MPLLPGFDDADLHVSVVEALKRFEMTRDAYVHGLGAIDAQYLRPLTGLAGDALAQANAVRAQMGLPSVQAHTSLG